MGAQHTDTDTYTYTAASSEPRAKSRAATSTSPSRMPRPSLVLSLLTVASLLLLTIDATPVFVDNPSLAQFQSGRNIRHLPCIVRKSGRSGVCMFAIDCIKQNGTHLGTCIDRFYFGSCCALKEEASLFAPEINDNSIDQNTISHFAHESTTLPTSALFKLTTESSLSTTHHQSPQSSTNELLKNVTQSYLSTSKPATGASTLSTTRRPSLAHTTHKNSHFVVRTTFKPSGAPASPSSTASSAPSTTTSSLPTVKPPRRRTTTAKPVLTTVPVVQEQRIETTSVPTKFVTFQIVETTTPPVTEPTRQQQETTTTAAPTRRHTRPTASSSAASRTTSKPTAVPTSPPTTTTTSTTPVPTTPTPTRAAVTTQRPTPPLRTTTPKPHKTHSSRRPAPSKKPVGSTSTTISGSQSTRKPIDSLASSTTITLSNNTATTVPARRPVIHTSSSSISSSTSSTTSSTSFKDELNNNRTTIKVPERTTQAPRPKPKPTGEIVKVPALLAEPTSQPTTAADTSSSISSSSSNPPKTSPSSTTPLLVTKKKPSTTTAGTTTTTSTTKPTRRATTKAPTTTTPKPTTTTPSTTTTTSKPSTTTTVKPLLTTEAPLSVPETPATKKPGLITWTDVEAEPPTNASISNDWQPAPPPNWMPLATPVPEASNKTGATTAPPSATDKVVISVATSVSEVETHGTAKPHKTTKPPRVTSTPKPPSTTTTTTKATTTATPTTVKTTEAPSSSVELASSTSSSVELSNEVASSSSGISSTISSSTTSSPETTSAGETTDYSGEEPNTTTIEATGSTTVAPANALEGVDYKEVCGRRMFPEPRIVGGANAAFGRWPWQISLRQWRTSTYLHKCGAALLNENWAITAAHCVDNVPPSDLLLRLGEYDLAEEEEPYGYQERRVQIVASHPQFDPRTFEYDLALLRFYEPVVFQPNIIPVCVPDNDENFIGQTAFVTGWGRLYEDGPLPSVLQEVAVPVINNTICESMYRSAGYIEHIPHIFICAGWKKGGYDSCEGDSGGPMVLQRESDKRFHLGGVISWGIGCAEANQPGVYTRISEFRDWINQILQF
ncbi:serine protease filzig [Drosophila kikkawai]|uniref:Serine protease filzig n=2 Tax=melanogaster group TaxID=32346 RepID=A0A6P4IZ39_DROKI|nr:serine proteinase stubble [Drosophila kikkawai]XP_017027583.1 serine proteinase stubble [Drosophila kikkawai]XP_017027584.1 serine proteinase stubble [Drosophila kikkawai]